MSKEKSDKIIFSGSRNSVGPIGPSSAGSLFDPWSSYWGFGSLVWIWAIFEIYFETMPPKLNSQTYLKTKLILTRFLRSNAISSYLLLTFVYILVISELWFHVNYFFFIIMIVTTYKFIIERWIETQYYSKQCILFFCKWKSYAQL